ncbi:hypothetical protein Cgig2_027145 [Carnegiea gigantea]|uniref:HTH myb-type domain-containing protein n=1 Tax=Carnegiea gigantea TaxID=171969 RepID=A0A9Q1QFB8_9CARY|nr:hypothetical protein Cgig2_027145 [Carnegiea gigantea]
MCKHKKQRLSAMEAQTQIAIKMHELEMGLPSLDDLAPLTQSLIPPQLALAFGINPEPSRTPIDLNKAVHESYSSICHREENHSFEPPLRLLPRPDCSKTKRVESSGPKEGGGEDNGTGRAIKRPRLVWTPQLHQRFVDVIERLGIGKAVPKTIMEMMNVEGLTRENVASHLQKYRLYLKRMEGLSNESHSNPRQVPSLMDCDGFGPGPMLVQQPPPLHCNPPSLVPMPTVVGPLSGPYGLGPMGFPVAGSASPGYCGLESGALNMHWSRQRGAWGSGTLAYLQGWVLKGAAY